MVIKTEDRTTYFVMNEYIEIVAMYYRVVSRQFTIYLRLLFFTLTCWLHKNLKIK